MERYKKKDVLEYIQTKLQELIDDIRNKFDVGELKAMALLLEQALLQCGVVTHNVIIKIKKG